MGGRQSSNTTGISRVSTPSTAASSGLCTQHAADVVATRLDEADVVPRCSDRYQRCSSTSWKTSAGSSLPRRSRGTARTTGSNDPGQPVVRDDLLVVALPAGGGPVGVEVVEQPAGLVLADVEAGEAQQPARVVAGVDDLGLDLDRRAVDVGGDRQLADVEAEVVEPPDPRVDPPALAAARTTRGRSARPTASGSAGRCRR